jgi:hypothetical protein
VPLGPYFKGHGNQVMSDMKNRYGDKKGESVFYATANKRNMKPGSGKKKPLPSRKGPA